MEGWVDIDGIMLKSHAVVVDVPPSLPPPAMLEQPSAIPHETSLTVAPWSLGFPDASNAWSMFPFFAAFCKPLLVLVASILGTLSWSAPPHDSPMHFCWTVTVKPTVASAAEADCKLRRRERSPLLPGAAVQSNEVTSTDVAVWP